MGSDGSAVGSDRAPTGLEPQDAAYDSLIFRRRSSLRSTALVAVTVALASAALAPAASAERLPIRVYTTADGLPSDDVSEVFADSRGFLWFGTVHGLSRFDGYRFTNYGVVHGLRNPFVYDLLESRDGTLWLGTAAGLCRFRPRAAANGAGVLFETFQVGTSERSNTVVRLLEDRAGRLWAGTVDGFFSIERSGDGVVARRVALDVPPVRPPATLSVWALAEDREGSLWLGTRVGLVRRLADGRTQWNPAASPQADDDRIRGLLFDRAGRLWAAHGGVGLFVLVPAPAPTEVLPRGASLAAAAAEAGPALDRDGRLRLPEHPGEVRHFTTADGLAHDAVRSGLLESRDGRIWIGTSGGVTVVEDGRFRSLGVAQGLSTAAAGPAVEDGAGNLWLRSEGGGAMRLAAGGWTTFDTRDGVGGIVRAVLETRRGELLVLTGLEAPHLARRVGASFLSWPMTLVPSGPLGWGRHQIAVEDQDGEWWFAGYRVFRYARPAQLADLARSPPKAVYTQRDGLGTDAFRIFADRAGDVWIGSFGSPPLSRWRRSTQSFRHYGPADGLPADVPLAFAEDRAGNLWIGFGSAGLVRHRPGSERFESFGPADGVPAGSIEALLLDRSGRLWMASDLDGVGRVDHPEAERPAIVHLTTRDGLSSDQVLSLSEDRAGRIYLATARGVDRLEPGTGRIRRYTAADGLVGGRLFTTFGARDGAIWMGTTNGLSRLLPAAEPPRRPPPILISALRIGGVARPLSETGEETVRGLELRPGQREVEIEFVGLSFATGERLRYQYRVEGGAGEWSAPSDQRTVTLANLAPGRYRFEVRATTADGLASPRPAAVAFRLPPPVWRRAWFLLLVAIAAALLAFAFHRQRLERLLAVERVRTRIATDLHDDLGASLSRISILSEVARHQLGRGEAPAGRLAEIADTARGLVDAAADIVWSIDPRRDDLHSLLTRLRRFASELLEAQGVAWSLTEPARDGAVRLSLELRQHLFLILKEAVTNAARHAVAQRVEVSISIADGRLRAEVRDDGRGFTPRPPEGGDEELVGMGNGLRNMGARARALGGELRVESAPGTGTRVSADLPLARRRPPWRRSGGDSGA